MKLSSHIIFDNLPDSLSAAISGPKDMELTIGRPELYEGSESFKRGHLYLLNADKLPQRAHAERGAMIVCIGDSIRLSHYRERCCLVTLPETTSFYSAFNVLQGIFDRFDAWEDDLNHIIEDTGEISRMLTRSEDIFQNPLFAIDGNFRILGASRMASSMAQGTTFESADGTSLRLGAFDQFLELHDLSMDEREPIVLNLLDQTTLSINLFDKDEYSGCLTVQYTNRAYRPSDKPLIAWLSKRMMLAMRQLATSAPDGRGSVRQAVQNLIEERPLDAIERDVLEASSANRQFVCMRLKLSTRLEQLPIGYVRNMLESSFAKSIVLEHHRNSVIAIIDIGTLGDNYCDKIRELITPFTTSMQMKAGLSEPFGNLIRSRQLFLQANTALDIGMLVNPEESLYRFSEFALYDMVMNATGDMSLDLLCPEGLRRLAEHDETAPTSYVETLRCYLENNMSVAKTASDLYVHRSTLMERLGRIKRELNVDLDNPDEQLRLRILLKAMQLRDVIHG